MTMKQTPVSSYATGAGQGAGRVFLLLQGPMSFFFSHLGAALRAKGATTWRALLCPGDRLYHRGPGGVVFRERPRDWPGFVDAFIANRGVTDLVCLGDGRRWHEDAIDRARAAGVRVHVVEQGYLRPHFLTVEPDGTGGRSRFPRDWPAIEALADGASPPAPPAFQSGFLGFATMDVAFSLANILAGPVLHPHYRTHMLTPPHREWAGWIWNKGLGAPARRRALAAATARFSAHKGPRFLAPLQLDTDFQMRLHAPPGGVAGHLRRVCASFAAHAPDDALLAVKAHPLDDGWANWAARSREAAEAAGIGARLVFFDGGDLGAMIAGAAGVVLANSTVGLTALQAGVPVAALGTAIYDLPRLTYQGDLDGFWGAAVTGGAAPDAARLQTLLSALGATIQVPGHFDGTGARPGADAVAAAMLAPAPY